MIRRLRSTFLQRRVAPDAKRVLILSYAFWPSVGGLEIASEYLAREFAARGYDVRLVTYTPAPSSGDDQDFPFEIVRQPNARDLMKEFARADIVLSKHLALKTCWPVLLWRKPFIVWHATHYDNHENVVKRWLRKLVLWRAISVANSHAIGRALGQVDYVIHPMFNEAIFRDTLPLLERKRDFIFVGRLVSAKGADLLLRALEKLPDASLTVVGGGAERDALERFAQSRLADRVTFLGELNQADCAALLRDHKVVVVPSKWEEPFGMVALEGAASGCHVVASGAGGLPEAAGPGAFIYSNGDMDDLAEKMRASLEANLQDRSQRADFVQAHTRQAVADRFIEIMTHGKACSGISHLEHVSLSNQNRA